MSESIPSLAATLAQIPDPRAARGRRHPWRGLLLLVSLGLLAGANTQRAVARFGHQLSRTRLRQLGLRQAPSQATLHRYRLTANDVSGHGAAFPHCEIDGVLDTEAVLGMTNEGQTDQSVEITHN